MRIEVMRGHTKSLDANDKLIQTRSHERDTIASRKRQVVMRKVKSTIISTGCWEKESGVVRRRHEGNAASGQSVERG